MSQDTYEQDQQTRTHCANVREIHIDFLLQEEFLSTESFLRQFLEAASTSNSFRPTEFESAKSDLKAATVSRVEHSVWGSAGEADLIVYLAKSNGENVALLVEDKIGACFQPRQAERYRVNGAAGIKSGLWQSYWTVLVAPEAYAKRQDGCPPEEQFDAIVTLEGISGLFAPESDPRQKFKKRIIEDAIDKLNRHGVQQEDEAITLFRRDYYKRLEDHFGDVFQELNPAAPRVAWSGDTWFRYKPWDLPKGAYVEHKAPAGQVDLTFPNRNFAELKSRDSEGFIEWVSEHGLSVVATGNSTSVRKRVPPIVAFDSFAAVAPAVDQAVHAVVDLLRLYRCNAGRFEAFGLCYSQSDGEWRAGFDAALGQNRSNHTLGL